MHPHPYPDDPTYLRGAGHAGLFRLLPEVTEERFLTFMKEMSSSVPHVGLTSMRVVRFDDGSYLHRMTFVSIAAWKRSSARVSVSAKMEQLQSLMDRSSLEVWLGVNTHIPKRFAPDLANPSVPRPVNPLENGMAPLTESSAAASPATTNLLEIDEVADRSIDYDDDAAETMSTVSGSVAFASEAITAKRMRRLPSFGSMSAASHSVTSAKFPEPADAVNPSPACLSATSLTTSIAAHPPSRAYTEARSSAGLTPVSPRGTPAGGPAFAGYWRSSVWGAPRARSPSHDPSVAIKGVYAAGAPIRDFRQSRRINVANDLTKNDMLPHVPESCAARMIDDSLPNTASPGGESDMAFWVIVDGPPHRPGAVLTEPHGAGRPKNRIIALPAVPAPPKHEATPQQRPGLHRPQPPTQDALGPRAERRESSERSTDSPLEKLARADEVSSTASTGRRDAASTTVVSSAESATSTTLGTTTRSVASLGSVSRGRRGKQAQALCVLVAFGDDKTKKRCHCDTSRCPEPQPGQTVHVRDGDDSAGDGASTRPARVLSVSAWNKRKGGASTGPLPSVVAIAA